MKNIIERFKRYAKVDTQSNPDSDSTPSTKKQFDLAKILYKELLEMGVKKLELTDECFIYAEIPANYESENIPKIGFVAHMDTSPDRSGENVNPQVIENYQGGDIELINNSQQTIKYNENKELKNCIGHTIITTDGTTLLGSDDKSGVTAIMELAKTLTSNPSFKHCTVGIAFTPDEEIGRGADKFNIDKFACDYAYTIDGEMPGELNRETFSADHAWIKVHGREIHPGSAKDIMINSQRILSEIIYNLPSDISPETTDGHQPYIHPHYIKGTVGLSETMLLFRAFDDKTLAKMKDITLEIINTAREKYPKAKIEFEVKKIYRNMLDELSKNPKGCDKLFQAAEKAGVNPVWKPIRGGTDGSKLTEMGLPCPNIFTGGQNFHSEQEWLSVTSLQKAIITIEHLVQEWAE
ncbi:peptidase T [Candidatus Kapabacteria bacterium]|nr:peptidase T [Candidatus Kapabacteria bacterium]